MKKSSATGILMAHLCFYVMAVGMMFTASTGPNLMENCQGKARKSLTQKKIESIIKDEYIAEVISKTKYPYLMAAIAIHESGVRPQIVGDSGESYGLFQIQRKHWGWLGDSVQCQADLCERILERLITSNGVEKGVQKYNGSGREARAYARRVIRTARFIERT